MAPSLAFLKKLRGRRLFVAIALAIVLLLVLARTAVSLYVDVLWFGSLGYLPVFLRTLAWTWGLRAAVGLAVAVVLYLNLRLVARGLGSLQIRRRFGNLEISERLPAHYVTWGIGVISLLLGAWLGLSVTEGMARSALMQVSAEPWGVVDPFLGLDLSFYVFALPLLRAGLTFLLVVTFLAALVSAGGYATTGTLRIGQGAVVIADGARRHLGVLAATFLLLLAVRLMLGMPLLLLFGSSDVQGIFGFTDARAHLRTLPIQSFIVALSAAALLVGAWKKRLMPVLVGVGGPLVALIGLGQLYPALVQRFQVVPNEFDREAPYIDTNLEFTRLGFGLDELERIRFDARPEGDVDWQEAANQLSRLPVWTSGTLLTTFREVEARYRYYDFPGVAMDRYRGPDGELVPVALAVREVDPAGIEEPNWQNLHLRERYVVGNGAVAVDAAGRTPQGRPSTFLAGIPAEFEGSGAPAALELADPSVFVGSRGQPYPYALVDATETEYLAPDGSPGEVGVDFPVGIPVAGLMRKLALAWYLREENVLFSAEIDADTRLVLRRGAVTRARELAPFLSFPEAAYPVMADGKIVWVLEAFTATRFFPLSTPFELEFRRAVSYARNSIKVTVDAVSGAVAFYSLSVGDPLLETYQRAYPELFRPIDEMPQAVREHLRYPRSLLELQAQVLLQYHQETASVFFGQQDLWAVPQELAQTTQPVPYQAEYGILRLPGDDDVGFHLMTSFVPAGRQNLTGILAGELREDGTFRLRVFEVPVENQISGPRQVEALVEQDPEISQQFSLWRTGGSRVWTGHLHLAPVGDRIIYMEPVFLAAEADAIPELRRFVVSDGRRVVMEESLDQALAALAGGEVRTAAPSIAGADPTAAPTASSASAPSARALELLDLAETRLREGDWAGFGAALAELRALLGGSSESG